jgi:hypothetical protein
MKGRGKLEGGYKPSWPGLDLLSKKLSFWSLFHKPDHHIFDAIRTSLPTWKSAPQIATDRHHADRAHLEALHFSLNLLSGVQ